MASATNSPALPPNVVAAIQPPIAAMITRNSGGADEPRKTGRDCNADVGRQADDRGRRSHAKDVAYRFPCESRRNERRLEHAPTGPDVTREDRAPNDVVEQNGDRSARDP